MPKPFALKRNLSAAKIINRKSSLLTNRYALVVEKNETLPTKRKQGKID